ncbi:MAG TPA: PilZ domain-containing protein [Terriglobia bacterium]|nr:PilZ domain-containing protein [Terriglobia bacterium]
MDILGRRRSERILAPVRIRVIGNDMSGVSFAEETVTVSFNQQGARISLIHSLLPDDVVLVKNLENGIEDEFRVVGAFQQVFGSRREWGVEALNQESGIWGVEFAPNIDSSQPKVLVECAACKTAAQSILSSIEYEVLLATGLISRHCDRCNETTRWKPSDQVVTPEILGRSSKPLGPGTQERRRSRRLKLTMQLRVRNAWGVVDIAQTRDVSKMGLCFISSQRFSVGDEIYITLPYAQNQAPVETPGKVIWAADGTTGRFYGVEYIR